MSSPNTHFGPDKISGFLQRAKKIHFSGVGGIMMSSLAILTRQMGYEVTGSDRTATDLTSRVDREGISVIYSQTAENTADCDIMVYTVAIAEDNPEFVTAKQRGIPMISRADYLGFIMTGYKNRVGIAGMHGKSSCTSMCAQIFIDSGADPTVVSGAEMTLMNGAFRIGGKQNFVFEACEYMDSFLDFRPSIALLLNAEMEHVDYFKSIEQIQNSFAAYASLTGPDGFAVYNADDKNICAAVENYQGHRLSFGINSDAFFKAVNIDMSPDRHGRASFDILAGEEFFAKISLSVPGYHHIYNALAAAAASYLCGISADRIAAGLENFRGAKRRMEFIGRLNGADVLTDYGHHPTEILSTVNGASMMGYKRLTVVFQSHTYSRTAELFSQFPAAFEKADRVIITPIYAAREKNVYGITPEKLANAIGGKASITVSMQDTADKIKDLARPGDLILVMGAGDIINVFKLIDFD